MPAVSPVSPSMRASTSGRPSAPCSYDVTVEAGADRVTRPHRLPPPSAGPRRSLLNGKPVFLRGVAIHAEAPFRAGRVYSEADARTLFQWAKETDCNFVRLPHYPHDEVMTRLADEMGLLVWSEIPVYWTISWENPETLAQRRTAAHRDDLARQEPCVGHPLERRQRNPARRSAPQVPHHPGGTRSLDSTRLITAAPRPTHADPRAPSWSKIRLASFSTWSPPNEYVGWYDGLPGTIDILLPGLTPYEKPFILSEFGADAQAGRHGDDLTRFTEEYQANVYRRQVAMFRRIPFLNWNHRLGVIGFPFAAPPPVGIQDFFNRKGLFPIAANAKPHSFILRDYYRSKESK